MNPNTLFLRLEGPMQAWGVQESKFVIRRTADAPTKSGVIGMLCAALGVARPEAADDWLTKLSRQHMGIRIDRPGVRWWDYHTVGARMRMRIAEGEVKTKPGAMLTRREYLADASFLVALQGDPALIAELELAMQNPKWTLYLGRKSCPPSRPIMEHSSGDYSDLASALSSVPWQPRLKGDKPPDTLDCLLDWRPSPDQPEAPDDAEIWYDMPLTFDPPSHRPRFVIRQQWRVGPDGEVCIAPEAAQHGPPRLPRSRADYTNSKYKKMRLKRLAQDHQLCVFCKSPATTVQHITYRHAGGDERIEELRSLCRLCHDAVTMIEYGAGMGLDRINPEEERWRIPIMEKREEIIRFRSLETRKRMFARQDPKIAAEEVE